MPAAVAPHAVDEVVDGDAAGPGADFDDLADLLVTPAVEWVRVRGVTVDVQAAGGVPTFARVRVGARVAVSSVPAEMPEYNVSMRTLPAPAAGRRSRRGRPVLAPRT